jgi:integrase/recombinase XerD
MIIWRRHVPPCQSEDRNDSRCGCPIHYDHRVDGKRIRRTLKTTNWQKALADIRRKEIEGFQDKTKSPLIDQSCESYLKDAVARELREPTLYKFRLLFRQMKEFAKAEGLVYVSDFNVDNVRRFRQSWPNKNFAARKKLEATRAFFRFCQQSGWIQINPAAVLKPGKTVDPEIVPITKPEFDKILHACETYPDRENRIRLRALVLLMWYTGLRVRDVVILRKDRIKGDKLFLRTAKTGTDVFCPLPSLVIEALDEIDSKNGYFFWTGQSKPKSAVGNYQRALKTLFELAGTPRVHAHLFRHTFATEMLLAGNSLETVAALLGHTSTKVTERSYSHWIKGRQEKLEEAVKNSWARLGSPDAAEMENS